MMQFMDPWSHIDISPLRNNEQLQFFDTKIRFIYSLLGSVTITRGGFRTTLGNDDFYLLTRSTEYDISKVKGKVYCFTFDYFISDTHYLHCLFQGDSVNKARRADFEIVQGLKQLLLLKASQSSDSASQVYKEYFTLIHLLEKYYASSLQFNQNKQGKNRVDEIKTYIDHYFDQDLSLSFLAKQIFVSEQYLSKIFKEEIGIGVSEYITKRRLEKVRRLLTESELPITDIAFSSGFSNINSFNRLFKKYQGLTPSVYRKETKQDIVMARHESQELIEDFESIKEIIENRLIESRTSSLVLDIREYRPFDHEKMMINLGYGGDLLHRSYVKSVKPIGQYTNFAYGRIWGIIGQNILTEFNGLFDFTKVDEIIQAVLDLGLKPFIELGIKGKVVYGSRRQVLKQSFLTFPTQSFEALEYRYAALIKHFVERYGQDEVANWFFEVWKPNQIVLQSTKQTSQAVFERGGEQIDISTNDGYFTYFKMINEIIKKIVPLAKLGGCGLSIDLEGKDTQEFLLEWSDQPIQPDFLSVCIFPMDILKNKLLDDRGFYISPNSDYLIRSISELNSYLKHIHWEKEVFITEFNVTISSRDIINDTSFKGPYILKNVLTILEDVSLLGYWQLSDFSSSSIDVAEDEIFGGSGLITKRGIPKPAFYAFEFLSLLGDQLLYQSDGIVITRRGHKLQMIAYHYTHLNSQYYFLDKKIFDKNNAMEMFEEDGLYRLSILIKGVEPERHYQMNQRRMGIHCGAILGEANQFSFHTRYRPEEIDYMKHRCLPKLSRHLLSSSQRGLSLELELQPHDMLFVEIDLY